MVFLLRRLSVCCLRFGAVSRSANIESKERNGKSEGEKVVRPARKAKPEYSHGFWPKPEWLT
jgi:hypothetical protein